jgi:hypothetical protein
MDDADETDDHGFFCRDAIFCVSGHGFSQIIFDETDLHRSFRLIQRQQLMLMISGFLTAERLRYFQKRRITKDLI